MTEVEWFECREPQEMLDWLQVTGKLSERKARLFAVGCCRRIWSLLPDEGARAALEISERYCDGLADGVALQVAKNAAISSYDHYQDTDESGNFSGKESASMAVAAACWVEADLQEEALLVVIDNAIGLGRLSTGWRNGGQVERRRQCNSLRDSFGPLPFRDIAIDPAWLAWNEGVVAKLAASIYEKRAFERMPILTDALEEAGCTDADILGHCRRPGLHARGCWVIDCLLGRK
jgi:hypothetical protein